MGTLVAIDAQNLYYSARRMGGKVDYQALYARIRRLEAESLCVVYLIQGDFDSSSFESLLRGIGYRLSFRQASRVQDGDRSRLKYDSHDIRISLDATCKHVNDYEKFILVSGDVDFSDLFSTLLGMGKDLEFWTFDRRLHPEMLKVIPKVEFLGVDLLQGPR